MSEEKNISIDPCSRLCSFLIDFKARNASMSYITSRHVIADISNLKRSDNAAIIGLLSDLLKIPAQIRSELQKVQGLDNSPFLEVVSEVEQLFATLNLDSNSDGFAGKITDETVRSLQLIGAVLRKDVHQLSLATNQREQLLEQVQTLIKEVKAAELENDFSLFLLNRLYALEYALRHYKYLGTEQIVSSVDELFGGLIRQAPSISQSQQKRSIMKRALEVGAAVLVSLQIANQSFELRSHFSEAIQVIEEQSQTDNGMASAIQIAEDEQLSEQG
jgi:hypothetical protein